MAYRLELPIKQAMPRAVEILCAAGSTGIIPFPTECRWEKRLITGWNFAGNLDTLNRAIKERVGHGGRMISSRRDRVKELYGVSGALPDQIRLHLPKNHKLLITDAKSFISAHRAGVGIPLSAGTARPLSR